jgi:beta-phosphoglucomutase
VKNDWYLELVAQLTPEEALPGAKELLKALKDAGIKTGLGSASKNAPLIIEKLGIAHLLDVVIDGNIVSKSKPDPEVFLKGAAALNVSPSHTVVFEDAVSGVAAAKTGGFFCVGIGQAEDLRDADFVVRDLSQINIELLNKTFFSH